MARSSLNRESINIAFNFAYANCITSGLRCVYYCMEYMDAGSLDKLQGGGIPEPVLARIAGSMVRGLKFLKDDLQIIHRGTFNNKRLASSS